MLKKMTQETKGRVSQKEFANKIFYEHYNLYIKELDIAFATLLAKRNSMLYIHAIIEKIENDGISNRVEDYSYYINASFELELINVKDNQPIHH